MSELVPNSAEAATEKHLPIVKAVTGDCSCGCSCTCITVEVGSTFHPMEEAHSIAFVYVETEKGGQRKCLKAGDEPKVAFCVTDDKVVAVYAYCNLHGLWKTEV
jgi:superoxide reductase